MLLLLFLFGLALGAAPPSKGPDFKLQGVGCPLFWYNFNSRCYKYVSTSMTWADAELHCLSQRANLVSIHSLEEQNFVRALIRNFDHNEGLTWIGFSDIHKEGSWMWSDGCPARFSFWQGGEPNNVGHEHCGHCNFGSSRRWNDVSCSLSYPSVCASRINCS